VIKNSLEATPDRALGVKRQVQVGAQSCHFFKIFLLVGKDFLPAVGRFFFVRGAMGEPFLELLFRAQPSI
jgi:hypothetical protein